MAVEARKRKRALMLASERHDLLAWHTRLLTRRDTELLTLREQTEPVLDDPWAAGTVLRNRDEGGRVTPGAKRVVNRQSLDVFRIAAFDPEPAAPHAVRPEDPG